MASLIVLSQWDLLNLGKEQLCCCRYILLISKSLQGVHLLFQERLFDMFNQACHKLVLGPTESDVGRSAVHLQVRGGEVPQLLVQHFCLPPLHQLGGTEKVLILLLLFSSCSSSNNLLGFLQLCGCWQTLLL